LKLLVEQRPLVLSKTELIERVWPGVRGLEAVNSWHFDAGEGLRIFRTDSNLRSAA
jgi:hypothetical protein